MSYPKKMNATFIVENELSDGKLYSYLEALGAVNIQVFGNTDHLKEDKTFNKLVKSKVDAGRELDRYINEHRND